MKTIKLRLLGIGIAVAWFPAASAEVLFSNLGQTENYVLSGSGPGPIWAMDLRAGSSATTITNITFNISFSQTIAQTFRVSLAEDNGFGLPGSVIGVFDTTLTVPSLGSGNYSARDAGLSVGANARFWILVEVIDGFGGGSALSATLSQLADAPSLFSGENSTPVMFSFDGLFYLPVQLGNLRFTLEGRPGAAPSLLVQSPPGGNGFAVTIRGLPGSTYRLEAISPLAETNWTELRRFTLVGSSTNILDSAATNFSSRFYRAVVD